MSVRKIKLLRKSRKIAKAEDVVCLSQWLDFLDTFGPFLCATKEVFAAGDGSEVGSKSSIATKNLSMIAETLTTRKELIKTLDATPIFDYLIQHGILNQETQDEITNEPSQEEQNTALLHHLDSHGNIAIGLFINALRLSGQLHLASALDVTNRINPVYGTGYWQKPRHKGQITLEIRVAAVKTVLPKSNAAAQLTDDTDNKADHTSPAKPGERWISMEDVRVAMTPPPGGTISPSKRQLYQSYENMTIMEDPNEGQSPKVHVIHEFAYNSDLADSADEDISASKQCCLCACLSRIFQNKKSKKKISKSVHQNGKTVTSGTTNRNNEKRLSGEPFSSPERRSRNDSPSTGNRSQKQRNHNLPNNYSAPPSRNSSLREVGDSHVSRRLHYQQGVKRPSLVTAKDTGPRDRVTQVARRSLPNDLTQNLAKVNAKDLQMIEQIIIQKNNMNRQKSLESESEWKQEENGNVYISDNSVKYVKDDDVGDSVNGSQSRVDNVGSGSIFTDSNLDMITTEPIVGIEEWIRTVDVLKDKSAKFYAYIEDTSGKAYTKLAKYFEQTRGTLLLETHTNEGFVVMLICMTIEHLETLRCDFYSGQLLRDIEDLIVSDDLLELLEIHGMLLEISISDEQFSLVQQEFT